MKSLSLFIALLVPASGLAQSVEWDVSVWGKPRAFTEHVEKLSDLVSQKTNGDFQINISYGGLSNPQDNFTGVSEGRFEMAQVCAGFHPDKTPGITVLELPFLGVRTLAQERAVSQYLYRHPAVVQDFARWNTVLLMPSPVPQFNLIGTGPTPTTLEDLAGVSVRATGSVGASMEALNAVPNATTASEVGAALEAGRIDAVAFAPHAHMSFRTVTSARWWTTNLDPGTVNCPIVANADAVLGLSLQHRDALYSSLNPALDHYVDNYEYNMASAWQPLLTALEIERVTFSEAELDEFRKSAAHAAALVWIEDMEQSGLPAVDLYRLVKIAATGLNPEQFLKEEAVIMAERAANGGAPPRANTQAAAANQESLVKKQLESLLSAYTFDKSPSNKVQRIQELPGQFEALPDSFDRDGDNSALPIAQTLPLDDASADALNTVVDWQYGEGARVGDAMQELAGFIGYELLVDNAAASALYSSGVPSAYRTVDSITVSEGFDALAGRGFVTVLDHQSRTVRHIPVQQ